MTIKYDPVKYNQLLSQYDKVNHSPTLLPGYKRLTNFSEAIAKQISNIVKNDDRSIIIIFTDKTWISILFEAIAYCSYCEDEIDSIDCHISLVLTPTLKQLINTEPIPLIFFRAFKWLKITKMLKM